MGRYLLGAAELSLLVGFAWLGATALRRRLVPELEGGPAHLATTVLGLFILLAMAELLGSFGLFEPLPYLVTVTVVGMGLWLRVGGGWGCPSDAAASRFSPHRRSRTAANSTGEKPSKTEGHPHPPALSTLMALLIAAIAVVKFGLEVKPKLSTGMTGFDSTWYHGPFAAGFFQSGDTWSLHFIAPQFLAWFYPANSEVFHGVGMLAFDRDLLSPLMNLGWFVGCLVASWCIGRPYRVAPFSLALGAIALSVPALSDQAGEARNDIVGIFFLLAAVAVALNAGARAHRERSSHMQAGAAFAMGPLVVADLVAGMAAGTKLNFLLPATVLVFGLALIAPKRTRGRALLVATLAALAGGGYWYLRNLAHTGNPLPWIKHLGPIDLPAPEQALGGRQGHSVLGYLTDGTVWSDWLLPGLHDGLTFLWPLLVLAAVAGLLLCLGRGSDPVLRLAAVAGLAAALAWLIAPPSASGPDGFPGGFESGLRYLAPALVLGLTLLPAAPPLRGCLANLSMRSLFVRNRLTNSERTRLGASSAAGVLVVLILCAAAIGYPIQRHYLENRYENPTFTTPGLNAAFKWAQDITDARIATTSTRQYPLFGRDLSNHVDYIGEEQPHGGFIAPTTCPAWRQLINAGNYDYIIASRDRIEPGKPNYPPSAAWTAGPEATVVLRTPPTVIYKLKSNGLSPSACR
ncbi:MAG TPA: hypothetical protein VN752_12250 [Solirubrobacterales bacterium]|nr:hypothetical protein [Solirubrobacterales bacterium]